MTRLTLHPAITSLSGLYRQGYFRKTRAGTLLVKQPSPPAPPTAAQLKIRDAWRRLDNLLPQVPHAARATLQALADAAGLTLRHHFLHHHLELETDIGHCPIISPNDYTPAMVIGLAQAGTNPGEIYFTHNQLPEDPPHVVGFSARRQIFPGPYYCQTFGAFPVPWYPAHWISCTITGLVPGATYAICAHFVRTSTGLYGHSDTRRGITAKA